MGHNDLEDARGPNLPLKPLHTQEPVVPVFQLPAAGDISESDHIRFKALMSTYKILLSRFKEQQKELKDTVAFIYDTLSAENLFYIQRTSADPYDILVKLKERFAPTTQARQFAIESEYHNLRKGSGRNQDVEKWMDDFIKVYDMATEQKIFEVSGIRPIRDFVLVMQGIKPNMTEVYLMQVNKTPENLKFNEVVEDYR